MNWTRKRAGVYECEAGMVVKVLRLPTLEVWWPVIFAAGGVMSDYNRKTLAEAKAAVEAAKEARFLLNKHESDREAMVNARELARQIASLR